MFLLDTDAVSEFEKPTPNPGLLSWVESVDWLELYISVITVAELWEGISRLPASRKRRSLEAMFDLLPDRFHNRILSVDYSVAIRFGNIQAQAGPLPVLDTLIAAIALTRRLTVISHNTVDMARTGASVLDPWS
ncbi:MAG TPA: type II toxin-antitoxin system VapC family toxin [Candidatus Binatia bacterium]|nr:type II toxin-antitoxin system VapC family toxin [Candidatus Binatia bacterium]